MSTSFVESGYRYVEKTLAINIGSQMSGAYVEQVAREIRKFCDSFNTFKGFDTNSSALKGDMAEYWHSGTFNINAILKNTNSRTFVNRSHDFASPDISSNFNQNYGLKYYKTGIDSAKQQAKSIFERFKEYQSTGGNDSLETFLNKRGFDNLESILNDPIYKGQVRIIPKDQLEKATAWLQRKIQEESIKRPEQVARYQETLNMLKDKIEDGKGTESIALSREDSERLAELAKKGNVSEETLKEFHISTEDLLSYEYVLQQAFKAGVSAATISMVLKVAPELFKAISHLIKHGELDEKQFQKLGFAALSGASEGFIRGSVAAAITTACKAGLWGTTLKNINPSVIGVVTVIAMNTMKNSFYVATGKMQSRELANELIHDMFVSTFSLVCGGVAQSIIEIPVLGFLLGSFTGSVIGSFAYNVGFNAILSFCIDTGFTMFGLVKQDYTLPIEVMEEIGIDVFQYDEFQYDNFEYDQFQYDEFQYDKFKPDEINISLLRRGVIGVNKIGYV